ncbi:MAG: hypothetical protein IKG27_00495 [Bacilli bacterium]|nr:hypothetical protein [Bacilli bacterium]
MDGLYTTVTFDENDKWFVAYESMIDGAKYSYLVKVNETGDDLLDEYMVMRSYYSGDEEYMDEIRDAELLNKIIPVLVPETAEYLKNPEKLKEMLKVS